MSSAELEIELNDLEILGVPSLPESQGPLIVNTSNIPPSELVVEAVPLDQSDIQELINAGPSRSYATVQHTRAYHHIAALKLASGEKPTVVAASLNLKPSTISRLQKDPQFMELIEDYRQQFVTQAVNTFELMQLVSMEAVTAIHEKLIGDERDSIPLEALRRIGETFADRTGHSPVRRSESLNVNASGQISDIALERVKARHREDARYRPELLQQTLEAGHAQEAENIGAKGSISAIFESVEEPKAERDSGEGKSL
ncbi:MAG: hypothetical protein ACWGQW_12325 [bacterium]